MAEDGFALQSQPPGAIMAHHCVQFATMVGYCLLGTVIDLLERCI